MIFTRLRIKEPLNDGFPAQTASHKRLYTQLTLD